MANLAQSSATLTISGDDLDPADISGLVGAAPDIGERKGETVVLPSGVRRVAETGRWQRRTASRQPGDPDSQIAALLAGLCDDHTTWQALAARFDVALTLRLYLDRTCESTRLSPETTALLAARGMRLDLEIQAPYIAAGSCGG